MQRAAQHEVIGRWTFEECVDWLEVGNSCGLWIPGRSISWDDGSYSLRRGMLGEELGGILWVSFNTCIRVVCEGTPVEISKHVAGYKGLDDGGEGAWGLICGVDNGSQVTYTGLKEAWQGKNFLRGSFCLEIIWASLRWTIWLWSLEGDDLGF